MKKLAPGCYADDVIDELIELDLTPEDNHVYLITDEDFTILCLKFGDLSIGVVGTI